MLTAAVRDLHRKYEGMFLTDVRTACPQIWENSPDITPLDEHQVDTEVYSLPLSLIHQINFAPVCLFRDSPIT